MPKDQQIVRKTDDGVFVVVIGSEWFEPQNREEPISPRSLYQLAHVLEELTEQAKAAARKALRDNRGVRRH